MVEERGRRQGQKSPPAMGHAGPCRPGRGSYFILRASGSQWKVLGMEMMRSYLQVDSGCTLENRLKKSRIGHGYELGP